MVISAVAWSYAEEVLSHDLLTVHEHLRTIHVFLYLHNRGSTSVRAPGAKLVKEVYQNALVMMENDHRARTLRFSHLPYLTSEIQSSQTFVGAEEHYPIFGEAVRFAEIANVAGNLYPLSDPWEKACHHDCLSSLGTKNSDDLSRALVCLISH